MPFHASGYGSAVFLPPRLFLGKVGAVTARVLCAFALTRGIWGYPKFFWRNRPISAKGQGEDFVTLSFQGHKASSIADLGRLLKALPKLKRCVLGNTSKPV